MAALPLQAIFETTMKHDRSELGMPPGAVPDLALRTLAMRDRPRRRAGTLSLRMPRRDIFPSLGWQEIITEVFRHRTHFLYVERAGRIEGVLPLAHVKSVLFGDALVSLPFAVYGGVVAESGDAATALEEGAQALAQRLASTISRCATSRRDIPSGRGRIFTSPFARRCSPTQQPTCSRYRASSGQWCAKASTTGS
jgi:hypothetical protein